MHIGVARTACPSCLPTPQPRPRHTCLHPGYDPVMPAQAGIQKDPWPPTTSRHALDPCLRRGDIVTSLPHIAFHANTPRLRPCHAYAGRHPEGSVMPPGTPPLSLKHRDSAWNPLAVSETHFTVKRAVDVGRAGHPTGGPDGMAKKALPWWGFCGIIAADYRRPPCGAEASDDVLARTDDWRQCVMRGKRVFSAGVLVCLCLWVCGVRGVESGGHQ